MAEVDADPDAATSAWVLPKPLLFMHEVECKTLHAIAISAGWTWQKPKREPYKKGKLKHIVANRVEVVALITNCNESVRKMQKGLCRQKKAASMKRPF